MNLKKQTQKPLREFGDFVKETIGEPKEAAAYLNAAAQDSDGRVFLMALKNVIDVHGGLSELARKTRLNRGNLHKMLTGKGNPRFGNVHKVLDAAGFELAIRPKRNRRAAGA